MNTDNAILWLLALPLLSSPFIYLIGRLRAKSSILFGKDDFRKAMIPGRPVTKRASFKAPSTTSAPLLPK